MFHVFVWILSLYLFSHPCSDQGEQVLQQSGIVLSVQVSQGALLPEGSIWVLTSHTHQTLWECTQTKKVTCGMVWFKAAPAQWPEEQWRLYRFFSSTSTHGGCSPWHTHTHKHTLYQELNNDLTTHCVEYTHTNSPADIFGVVFNVIRKISNLVFGDALQPVND